MLAAATAAAVALATAIPLASASQAAVLLMHWEMMSSTAQTPMNGELSCSMLCAAVSDVQSSSSNNTYFQQAHTVLLL
jgi:hypothetical protein